MGTQEVSNLESYLVILNSLQKELDMVWGDQIEASEDTGTIIQVIEDKTWEATAGRGKKQTWVV